MKISLSLDERKYLGALIKILAVNTATQPGATAFWRSIYEQLAPNRPTADLRRKEIESMLAICQKGVQTLKNMRTHDEAASLRVDHLGEVLAAVTSKIEAKLKEATDERDRTTERHNDPISNHCGGEEQQGRRPPPTVSGPGAGGSDNG